MANKTIFSNQVADGNSSEFKAIGGLNSSAKIFPFLTVYGEFDGASVQLEYQAANGNWYSTGDDPFTSSCAYFTELNSSVSYRLSLSGAGASTSISSTIYDVA